MTLVSLSSCVIRPGVPFDVLRLLMVNHPEFIEGQASKENDPELVEGPFTIDRRNRER